MLLSLVRGDGALGWLGARSSTFVGFHPAEVPQWFVFLAAGLVLYVTVIPVAATAVLCGVGLRRAAGQRVRLFAALVLPTLMVMLVSVAFVSASLDVDGTENLNERYVFYVVPLFFVGLALWMEEGLPRPRRWAWVVVLASACLVMSLPIDRLVYNSGLQSVALLPWLSADLGMGVGSRRRFLHDRLWMGVAETPSADAGRLWIVVIVVMFLTGAAARSTHAGSSASASKTFAGLPANWIDAALPAGAEVVVIWDQRVAAGDAKDAVYSWLMVAEAFNNKLQRVMRLGPPTYYEAFLPTIPVRILARIRHWLRARPGEILDPATRSRTVVLRSPGGSSRSLRMASCSW